MNTSEIVVLHEQTREFVYPISRKALAVRVRVQKGGCTTCRLSYWNRNRPEECGHKAMERFASDDMWDYFETMVETAAATRYLRYYFEIVSGGYLLYLNDYGLRPAPPKKGCFEYCYSNENDIFAPPDWVHGCTFYQIFPDRFCRGRQCGDDRISVWDAPPTAQSVMGGDLKGIIAKLPYLKELGIGAIYLNPIFTASSNHKYDTVDYFQIDPDFGSLEDLTRLTKCCHQAGIRVILDGVFNHCGYLSPIFQDVLKKGRESEYCDWFYVEDYPVSTEKCNYETIGYFHEMPKLRLSNRRTADYILRIAQYWMRTAGVDGWRLDVAEEMDTIFLQRFRREMKGAFSGCFIVAETWRENRDLLRGDIADSIMNYTLRDAVIDFFAEGAITAQQFDRRVQKIIGAYSKQAVGALFNIIGSHDTQRILTSCEGDKRKGRMAAAFQFGFPGVPVVYYGDEIGMLGKTDPDCRKAMEWNTKKWDTELREWYRKLISLKQRSDVMRYGAYTVNIVKDDGLYGFYREYCGRYVYFVFNNDNQEKWVRVPVAAYTGEILTDWITKIKYEVCGDTGSAVSRDCACNGIVNARLCAYGVLILISMEMTK